MADILDEAQADGAERTLLIAHFTAAGLEVAVGDGGAALRHLDAIPVGDTMTAFNQFIAWGGAMRAKALVLCGRQEEARAVLRNAFPAALSSGDQPILAETVLAVAVLLADLGETESARRAFAASVHLRGALDSTDPSVARLVATLGAPDPHLGEGNPAS